MTFLFIRKATEAEIKKDPSRFSELKIVIFFFYDGLDVAIQK